MTRGLGRAFAFAVALASPSVAGAQRLRSPLACDDCVGAWFYFDQDPGDGTVVDHTCGGASYDGHRGTDFALRGGNRAIDAGHDVVASAAGTVVRVQDGYHDRCSACGGDGCGIDFGYGYGNHVVVASGEFTTVYGHLRRGSLRVALGDTVECGQVLGQVGSSGCSTGAHLHLEVRPPEMGSPAAFDPYAGPCSPTSPSLWTSQGEHRAMPGRACDGAAPDAGSGPPSPPVDPATPRGCRCGTTSERGGPGTAVTVSLLLGTLALRRRRPRRCPPNG